MSNYRRKNFKWKSNVLFLGKRKMAEVIPDETYENMFRIKYEDGLISDMFNLSRARNNAIEDSLQTLSLKHAPNAPIEVTDARNTQNPSLPTQQT